MIGLWVARYRGERRLTLFHYVESEIADRKVTNCGRQLGEKPGTTLNPVTTPPSKDVSCYQCQP
jgi:hypothetical protein